LSVLRVDKVTGDWVESRAKRTVQMSVGILRILGFQIFSNCSLADSMYEDVGILPLYGKALIRHYQRQRYGFISSNTNTSAFAKTTNQHARTAVIHAF
jgi:hypothetical protein